MTVPATWDWWIGAMAIGLAVAAAGLLLWALFWDRSRGRRRCPRCWYDMKGVPGLRCPECGSDARRESRLLKTRRRWRWVGAAMVLVVASAPLCGWLQYQRDGPDWWASRVPTVLIIAKLPEAGTPPSPDPKTGKLMYSVWEREMARRATAGHLRDWHWRWAIKRTRIFRTREVWPALVPVRVGVWPPSWIGGNIEAVPRLGQLRSVSRWSGLSISGTNWNRHVAMERNQTLGLLPEGEHHLEFDVEIDLEGWSSMFIYPGSRPPRAETWKGMVRLPVRIAPAEEQVMTPATDQALDDAARRAVRITCYTWSGGATISLFVDQRGHRELDGIALGCIIEVVRDSEVVESRCFWPESAAESEAALMNRISSEVLSGLPREELLSGRWSLRVCGDHVASLREFDCDRYWAGRFEVPLAEVLGER
jgi:hypothetical protein